MKTKENKSADSINWEPTARRYVCYIDIMGFANMIATKENSEIYEMMKRIVGYQKLNARIAWGAKPNLVKTTTYSDSIIIYSINDDSNSLAAIMCTAAGLIQDLLTDGIPFKGALSAGIMTCDYENSIFFGQPLIDSYLLQEELYLYGIIIHGTAQERIENHNYIVFTHTYNCPLKKGKSDHLIIQPMLLGLKGYEDENKKLIESVNNMKFTTSGHLRVYIDSTIDYLKTVEARVTKSIV